MTRFVISSFCTLGNCVQVTPAPEGGVLVSDSKDAAALTLTFTAEEWNDFVKGVKNDEFDLDVLHGPN